MDDCHPIVCVLRSWNRIRENQMMTLTITIPCVSIAHRLQDLDGSPCQRLHGHNYRVKVRITGNLSPGQSMIVDFSRVKALVNEYDHTFLGNSRLAGVWYEGIIDHPEVEPSTAEVFASVLADRIGTLGNFVTVCVDVWETPNNKVSADVFAGPKKDIVTQLRTGEYAPPVRGV